MYQVFFVGIILVGAASLCTSVLLPEGDKQVSNKTAFQDEKIEDIGCSVSLLHKAGKVCESQRHVEKAKMQYFYKFSRPDDEFPPPHLDHAMKDVLVYFMTEKFHAHWFNLYFNVLSTKLRNLINEMVALKYKNARFTSYDNYTQVHDDFKDYVIKATSPLPHYRFPSRSYEYFVDLSKNERFKSDRYFAEQRLAGINTMAIRRVDYYGKWGTLWANLKTRLGFTRFNWESAISAITGKHIWMSIMEHRVYVVEYPMLEGLPVMSDTLKDEHPNKKMRPPSMPIALFAVDPQGQFRVVAIQNDTKQGAAVFTPKDGVMWDLAKAQLQQTDIFAGQLFEHLLRTHIRMEPLCISLHRQLSSLHPIHQILKYHCRGLIPLNARGKVTLLVEPQTTRSLFPRGNLGASALLIKEFYKMTWNDIDIVNNIKDRGMGDTKILPHYPYRDDGMLVVKELEDFAKKLVDMFYESDWDVKKDIEIQALAQELSGEAGAADKAANPKIRGFKSSFKTKSELASFVKETLWIVVQHSMYSFPIADYGSTEVYPTKLYEGTDESLFDMLPGKKASLLQGSLVHGLGSLHYDKFFDYSDELISPKLQHLVKRAYNNMKYVRDEIHERNRKRFEAGHLTNPFMMQEWMPNSIST